MDIVKIKQIMKAKDITQSELSNMTKIPLQTIKCIMSGRTRFPRIDTVEAIENALGISQNVPALPQDSMSIGKGRIPLVGQVVAGVPVESSEYLEGYITVDYPHPENYFALRVSGDSMINARIFPGDILVVRKQNSAESGDIIVAAINGESTVKRYKIIGESTFLMPENSKYDPIPITKESNLYIFGKVVRVMYDM